MKREHAIAYLRIAGYDNDRAAWTRLYVENRVSYAAAKKAWEEGVLMRQAGVPRSMPK
jgi:hypothetical protein